MIGIILTIGSIVIIAGAAWYFLQWRCPEKKKQITNLAKEITEEEIAVEKVSDLITLEAKVKKAIENIDEDTTDEKEKAKLTKAQELEKLVETVKEDKDLISKHYSWLNIAYTAGVFLGLWLILNWISKKVASSMQSE